MLKEVLIVMLQWVDPTVHVVPVVQVCPPAESQAEIERNDARMKKNMEGFGKAQPGVIVDPWGAMPSQQRDAIEHRAQRSGAP
jgi:hypothetical protein